MPLHNKRGKKRSLRSKRLRKSKRSHKRRTRRVRFLGGAAGIRWFDTPIGPMSEKEHQAYQEHQDRDPSAY